MSAAPVPEVALRSECELGEGPVWRREDQSVWFVDIKGHRVHRFEPSSGTAWSWLAPDQVGFIVPAMRGGWIAGLKTGLHHFDPVSGAFRLIDRVEDPALGNRLNDGFVDPKGRLWFGSMDDGEKALTGALYRFDQRGVRRMDDGYCITNGPTSSPDGRILYHTDTLKKVIYAFDVSEAGDLSKRRVFARIAEGSGYPDGPITDAEGCVWTGLYGGWGVRRFSPKGEVLASVRFPVANVTKVAFGGPDLTTVYATTAWKGLSQAERAAQPLAGSLFRFDVDTPGLPQHAARHG